MHSIEKRIEIIGNVKNHLSRQIESMNYDASCSKENDTIQNNPTNMPNQRNEEEEILNEIENLNGIIGQKRAHLKPVFEKEAKENTKEHSQNDLIKIDLSCIIPASQPGTIFQNANAVYERQIKWKEVNEKKIQETKKLIEQKSLEQCTFVPEKMSVLDPNNQVVVNTCYKPFLKREDEWRESVQKQIKMQKDSIKNKETDGCTFTPKTGNVLTQSIVLIRR